MLINLSDKEQLKPILEQAQAYQLYDTDLELIRPYILNNDNVPVVQYTTLYNLVDKYNTMISDIDSVMAIITGNADVILLDIDFLLDKSEADVLNGKTVKELKEDEDIYFTIDSVEHLQKLVEDVFQKRTSIYYLYNDYEVDLAVKSNKMHRDDLKYALMLGELPVRTSLLRLSLILQNISENLDTDSNSDVRSDLSLYDFTTDRVYPILSAKRFEKTFDKAMPPMAYLKLSGQEGTWYLILAVETSKKGDFRVLSNSDLTSELPKEVILDIGPFNKENLVVSPKLKGINVAYKIKGFLNKN